MYRVEQKLKANSILELRKQEFFVLKNIFSGTLSECQPVLI